jgi:hypothetical protein
MVMLTAYFDESYNHRTKDNPNTPLVYTVAGCVGDERQWKKFQKKWKEALERDVLKRWQEVCGAEKKLFFHMKEFDNPHSKIYGDWPKQKKATFLAELHKIMERQSMRRFSVGIVISDYDDMSVAEKYAFGDNPHVCAIVTCMKHIGRWANQAGFKEPMQYVFEQGSKYDKEVNTLFKSLTDEEKEYYRVGGWSFEDKRKFLPLQTADIIAVETRKELSRQLETGNTRKTRASIRNLRVESLDEWFYMDRQAFDEAIAQFKRVVNEREKGGVMAWNRALVHEEIKARFISRLDGLD